MPPADKSDNVRAVGRALDILLAFNEANPELSAAQLLERVDLSRPTLYRLAYTLQESGFLVSVGEPQRFRLGPAIARLAHVWKSTLDLATLAEPVLHRLWETTRETVALFVPQGAMRLCVAELASPQPLNFKRGMGYTERIVLGASGRAILASMARSPEQLRELVRGTDIDPVSLEKQLETTRQRGYASSHSELISGAVGIAAAFFDWQGTVAGSIGVFGPEVRMDAARQQDIAKLLLQESAALSQLLGQHRGIEPVQGQASKTAR